MIVAFNLTSKEETKLNNTNQTKLIKDITACTEDIDCMKIKPRCESCSCEPPEAINKKYLDKFNNENDELKTPCPACFPKCDKYFEEFTVSCNNKKCTAN